MKRRFQNVMTNGGMKKENETLGDVMQFMYDPINKAQYDSFF